MSTLALATWAVIDSTTNIVVNRIWWDADVDQWTTPAGTYVIQVDDPAAGGIGDSYDPNTGGFTKADVGE